MGTRKTFQKRPVRGFLGWACAVEASKLLQMASKSGRPDLPRDESGGCPDYWPGGVWRRGGVSLVCGSCTEREKASVDTATRVSPEVARGSVPRQKPEALSTDAALAGGPARSSREAAARWGGGGAKGPAHQDVQSFNRGVVPWEEAK